MTFLCITDKMAKCAMKFITLPIICPPPTMCPHHHIQRNLLIYMYSSTPGTIFCSEKKKISAMNSAERNYFDHKASGRLKVLKFCPNCGVMFVTFIILSCKISLTPVEGIVTDNERTFLLRKNLRFFVPPIIYFFLTS